MSIVASLSLPYWLDNPAETYPPLVADERVDVCVVGGGVSGLACARTLAADGLRVRLLEAHRIAGGASGRNGGFALRGLAPAYADVPARDLWQVSEEALARLAALAGGAFRPTGSLRVAADEEELEAVRAEHDALSADGFAVEWRNRDELPAVLRPHFDGGIFHPTDGLLHPGQWARGLAASAAEAGAALAELTPALELEGTAVRTAAGTVEAGVVVIATDGYTHGLLSELDGAVRPARAQMLATAPLPQRVFDCAVYARYGFDYWQQTEEGRVVIGGWRDANLAAEFTRSEETTPEIQSMIEEFLARLFGRVPPVTHRWAGLLGFTPDALPIAGPLPDRDGVWTCLGYSGHGNVLALACGEAVGAAILGRPDPRLAPLSPERILGSRARG